MNECEQQLWSVIEDLKSASSSICCENLHSLLTKLGFEVRNGKKQGHKIVTHDGIDSFYSASYTCGHGKNPEIKSAYIKDIIKLLSRYESELIRYLGEKNGH